MPYTAKALNSRGGTVTLLDADGERAAADLVGARRTRDLKLIPARSPRSARLRARLIGPGVLARGRGSPRDADARRPRKSRDRLTAER